MVASCKLVRARYTRAFDRPHVARADSDVVPTTIDTARFPSGVLSCTESWSGTASSSRSCDRPRTVSEHADRMGGVLTLVARDVLDCDEPARVAI